MSPMQVIKGWDEGVAKMSLGEKAILKCTPDYGRGGCIVSRITTICLFQHCSSLRRRVPSQATGPVGQAASSPLMPI